MAVTRNMIKELLRKLNEAGNSRPNCAIEETIAAIDAICTPNFQGRLDNQPFHDRETERQGERVLFTDIKVCMSMRFLSTSIILPWSVHASKLAFTF